MAQKMNGSFFGLLGGIDVLISVSEVEALESACIAAGIPNRIQVFPEAPHSFCDDHRLEFYHQTSCEAAWKEVIAFLYELKTSAEVAE